jgi:LEA14-like dessication related protein
MNRRRLVQAGQRGLLFAVCVVALAANAAAQRRSSSDPYTNKLISVDVREVTLDAIDFRSQLARMTIALDIRNPIPIKLKDFDYELRLFGLEAITGNADGEMQLGGKKPAHVNLPIELNLRAIPQIVWSAFKNRGRLKFDLDTAFTLPLFVIEKRFDKSFSGEVPLKSLVDAATLFRASQLGF